MSEQEVCELSAEVANLYGIAPKRLAGFTNDFLDEKWIDLHDDWERLMPLAIEHLLGSEGTTFNINDWGVAVYNHETCYECCEKHAAHPTEERAVAVAILKALKDNAPNLR